MYVYGLGHGELGEHFLVLILLYSNFLDIQYLKEGRSHLDHSARMIGTIEDDQCRYYDQPHHKLTQRFPLTIHNHTNE